MINVASVAMRFTADFMPAIHCTLPVWLFQKILTFIVVCTLCDIYQAMSLIDHGAWLSELSPIFESWTEVSPSGHVTVLLYYTFAQ
jgi:hypothetical protein